MKITETENMPDLGMLAQTAQKLKEVCLHTPLANNLNLSERYQADIWFKREDLQPVRSYKLRGAFDKISSLPREQLSNGVVCASAGNHAQGVAYSCRKLGVHGTIFMPVPTPQQKVNQVEMFGRGQVEIVLDGDTFDDAYATALAFCREKGAAFIHPFDDPKVIEGQATLGLEILADLPRPADFLFLPVGGGGLASGVGSVFRERSPHTRIIGVEPVGAPAMKVSLEAGKIVSLPEIDRFVDGAAVKRVGDLTFRICQQVLDRVVTVDEGDVCTTIIRLYEQDAIVVEPAGALSITALEQFREEIRGKTVVCLLSGSNNDITRMEEIKERSLLAEGLKHYFIIRFPQRAGALKQFVSGVMGPHDDITYFQYSKKHNREKGPALVGIEMRHREDFYPLIARMEQNGFAYEYLNDKPDLFQHLI